MRNLGIVVLFAALFIAACTKDFEGDPDTQTTPETFAVVDSIRRDSNNLLSTTVSGNWWGISKSGFIKGYEVSIDNQQTWSYTTNQKGTFLLNLPPGQQSGNLPIYIRAIDNLGQVDPTPAMMVFPVKNSPPTIAFDNTSGRKTSALAAFRFSWIVNDVDGLLDVQSIEVVLNDTNKTPLLIPGNTAAASFVANSSFDTSLLVYLNNRTIAFTDRLHGVQYNALNKVYIRSVDRAGAKSAWTMDSIRVKRPVSDFLVVNDYKASKVTVGNFYMNQINALGASYALFDTIDAVLDQLPTDEFTAGKVFDFYKRIVWFSDDPNSTLSLAQVVTRNFFTNGGRMFLVCEMPNDFTFNSPTLGFTPAQELVVPPSGTTLRMNVGEIMYPHVPGNGWPTLKATSILSSARPFVTFTQASGAFAYDSICRANLLAQTIQGPSAWTGVSTVLSRRLKVSTGKPDLILLTLPLNRLNGNNNMDSLFRKALVNELEF